MIVTVLIRYKSWQSQFFFVHAIFIVSLFFFAIFLICFMCCACSSRILLFSFFYSHYAHKLCEIYLLSALEKTHGTYIFIHFYFSCVFFYSLQFFFVFLGYKFSGLRRISTQHNKLKILLSPR